MKDEVTDNVQGYFDKMYGASDEVKKNERKSVVKNRLKRKFHSAYDDAEEKILNALEKIDKVRSDFENYDVNSILEQKQDIETLKELQVFIRQEYEFMFGIDTSVKW